MPADAVCPAVLTSGAAGSFLLVPQGLEQDPVRTLGTTETRSRNE